MLNSPPHNYVDILDIETLEISTQPKSSPNLRSYMAVQHTMYITGSNTRAVNRLPLDVLHQIFELYFDLCPVVYTDGPLRPGIYNNMSQQLSPLRLSHVCASWRAVMSSSPEFWSTICIIGPKYKQGYAIDTWLGRARPLLTDILLIQTDRCRPFHELEKATDQVLDAIIRHSSYCRRLRLEFRCSEFQKALSGIDARNLQSLEAIHLELPPWTSPNPEISRFWSKLYQAPRLSRVSWETCGISPPLHLSRWKQLTWINCGGSITQSNLWSILKETPRLIRLRVRGIFIITDPLQPPALDPITHNSLKIMDLEFKSSPIQFYCNLTIPNLTSLRIAQNSKAYDPADDRVMIRALSRFLQSLSDPSMLESFTILDPTLSQLQLTSLLRMKELQQLEYLGLDYATEQIIQILSCPRQTSSSYRPLLPNLQRLEIFNRYLESFQMSEAVPARVIHQAVKRLLESRPEGFSVSLNPCGLVLTANTLFVT